MPLLSRGCGRCRDYLDELYREDKGRIGGNDDFAAGILHIFPTVGEAWRYRKETLTPFFHAVYAYLEAWNKALGSEDEGKWLIAVSRRAVEYGAISEFAFVEERNGIPGLCLNPGTYLYILALYLVCGRGSCLLVRSGWRRVH